MDDWMDDGMDDDSGGFRGCFISSPQNASYIDGLRGLGVAHDQVFAPYKMVFSSMKIENYNLNS